jgi:hypothetical protein
MSLNPHNVKTISADLTGALLLLLLLVLSLVLAYDTSRSIQRVLHVTALLGGT